MRQICPHCQKAIDVPESAAGGEFACPACGEVFPVPKAYTPAVAAETYSVRDEPAPAGPAGLTHPGVYSPGPPAGDRPPPPPGFIPPALRAAAPPAEGAGELRSRVLVLAPGVVGWVPVACLALCLLLTFFPWVGSYPGGYRVFSQTPWQAGVGSVGFPATAAPQELQEAEPRFQKDLTPPNLFMLLYGVLLVVTVALAGIERAFPAGPHEADLPGPLAWVPGVWPYRFAVLLGLAGLLLFLVLFQAWRGFGLETAVERYAADRHDAALKAADTKAKEQVAQIQAGMDAARFAVRPTTARDLALALHVVAVLGLLARVWLDRRDGKPPPQVVVQY